MSALSPGNSIGTLTVSGDLTFAPGSTYRVEAALASADSDRVVVKGIARLAGSVLHMGPDGNFMPNLNYTGRHRALRPRAARVGRSAPRAGATCSAT